MSNVQHETYHMPLRFIIHSVCQPQKAFYNLNSALIDFPLDVFKCQCHYKAEEQTLSCLIDCIKGLMSKSGTSDTLYLTD